MDIQGKRKQKMSNRAAISSGCFLKIVLPAIFFICIVYVPAFSVDFVTKEEFATEKSVYKDYPLKILFKKLAETEGAEKREIKNEVEIHVEKIKFRDNGRPGMVKLYHDAASGNYKINAM